MYVIARDINAIEIAMTKLEATCHSLLKQFWKQKIFQNKFKFRLKTSQLQQCKTILCFCEVFIYFKYN